MTFEWERGASSCDGVYQVFKASKVLNKESKKIAGGGGGYNIAWYQVPCDSCVPVYPTVPASGFITGCGCASVDTEKRRRSSGQHRHNCQHWPSGGHSLQASAIKYPVIYLSTISQTTAWERQHKNRGVIIFHHFSFVFTTSSVCMIRSQSTVNNSLKKHICFSVRMWASPFSKLWSQSKWQYIVRTQQMYCGNAELSIFFSFHLINVLFSVFPIKRSFQDNQ